MWRAVLRRAASDRVILAAAFVTILLSTTLLSAGPIYASAVTSTGLQRSLRDAPATAANLELSRPVDVASYPEVDARVHAAVTQVFASVGADVARSARSGSFALPGQDEVNELAVLAFFEGIEEHATLDDGVWPSGDGTGPALETAIPVGAAEAMGREVGQTLTLTDRLGGEEVAVRIVGTYAVDDPSAVEWWNEPLETAGVEQGRFAVFGPFVTTEEAFTTALEGAEVTARWRVAPAFGAIGVEDLGALRRGLGSLGDRLDEGEPSSRFIQVDTRLPTLLEEAERSLLVTRSGVLISTVQLALLAAYALLFTAGLVIEQRRMETALLRARGAAPGQVGVMSLLEGSLLAVPATILGPLLAVWAVRLLDDVGPLAAIDLRLAPQVDAGVYLLAAATALSCVAALVLPTLTSAKTYMQARAATGREGGPGLLRRTGIDLGLLVLAGIGYWQLRHYGAPITRTVQGALGLDPFLILAPTIGLLAGAVLTLRVVPLLTGAAERLAATRPGLVGPLGSWQLARRPSRHTRAALMLILAVAIGLFTASYERTWARSQQDQADFQVGADLAVAADRSFAAALSDRTLGNAYRRIDGVQHASPVVRRTVRVAGSQNAELVAVDAAVAPSVVTLRDDLTETPPAELFAPLAEHRPTLGGVAIPADATSVRATASISTASPIVGSHAVRAQPLVLVLQDADGMITRVASEPFVPDGATRTVAFDLTEQADDEARAPAHPLQIVGIEVRIVPPVGRTVEATATVTDLTPVSAGAALELGQVSWGVATGRLVNAVALPEATVEATGSSLRLDLVTGAASSTTSAPVVFRAQALRSDTVEAIPVLANAPYLDALGVAAGETLTVDLGASRVPVEVVAAVRAFPTIDPEVPTLVVDHTALASLEYLRDGRSIEPDAWWLDVRDADAAAVHERLTGPPFSSRGIQDRFALARSLRTDPVALGIIGALGMGFVAATLFAIIGFAVGAAVSARERLTEFSLLRAVGLSGRQLSGWLSLENGAVVALGVVGGTVLGLALSWLVLPLVSLTPQATIAFPEPIVTVPWGTLLRIELLLVVVLGAVVIVLTRLLRRVVLASALRFGEER